VAFELAYIAQYPSLSDESRKLNASKMRKQLASTNYRMKDMQKLALPFGIEIVKKKGDLLQTRFKFKLELECGIYIATARTLEGTNHALLITVDLAGITTVADKGMDIIVKEADLPPYWFSHWMNIYNVW
jgi:hypothetical protein